MCQVSESIGETLSSLSIDNRARKSVINQSIIDRNTYLLREKLHDPTIDSRMVAKIVQNLSEKTINDLVDYALRKAQRPGRAFIKLCYNVMEQK